MGDLLSKEMLGDLIINIINIAILFFATKALLYKPVKKALDSRRAAQAKLLEEAEQLQTALRLIESEDAKTGAGMLKTLSETSTRGYRYLAAFHYVDYMTSQGQDKYAEAVETLNGIVGDSSAPQPFRNLALFDRILLQSENSTLNTETAEAELTGLAARSEAWAPLAFEFLADLALRQGDAEKAKAQWQKILAMPGVSEEKRLKIAEYVAFADSGLKTGKK